MTALTWAEKEHIDHRRGSVCGKMCYPSKEAAKRANARARFRVRAYRCPLCHWQWHVANGDKRTDWQP